MPSAMKTPIEIMMDSLTWVPILESEQDLNDLPYAYATHSAVLDIMGLQLRVYLLSTGQRVINADDLAAVMTNG